MSTGSGSHVSMWISRRAPADWVTLIASRVVAAARNATPYLLVRHLRGHRVRHTTRYMERQLVAVESQRATT